MALLKITTRPIEYEIKIEKAKLVAQGADAIITDNINLKTSPPKRCLQRTAEQIKSVEQAERESANFQNLARRNAGARMRATSVNASIPNSMNSFDEVAELMTDMVISQDVISLYREYSDYEMLNPDSEYLAEYSEYQSNVEITSFVLDGSKHNEWNVAKNQLEFVPGRFQMEITQYPEVIIEYTGGFNYVPPSSDPNYEEEI